MKQILGLVGEKRAGKDTFCEHMKEIIPFSDLTRDITIFRYSDMIATCLDAIHLPKTRENMQGFSPLIEIKYGKGVFSRAMTERAILAETDLVIIQGMRWMTDLAEIRRIGATLVYVTADKKIRFERAQKNAEKPDEVGIAWEKFEEQENAETEIFIPIIGAKADFRLENNGTEKEFRDTVQRFAARYLPGWQPK